MTRKSLFDPERLDLLIAILIALVSLSTALAAWRTNVIGSAAGDYSRTGLIDAIKQQAGMNEDVRKLYQEAGYARNFAVADAATSALENSEDPLSQAQARNLRQYLLPNLQLIGSPLASESKYALPDGTYDLEARFADIQAEASDITNLDPQASFALADSYFSQQNWLTMGTVLMAVSLFWLGLAEIGAGRWRVINLLLGVVIFILSVGYFFSVEVIFWILRGVA